MIHLFRKTRGAIPALPESHHHPARWRQSKVIAAATVVAIAVSMSAGCSHPSKAAQSAQISKITPFPQPTDSLKTYPVGAAFSPTGPRLMPQQRAWIRRVMKTPSYANLPLRFALLKGVKTPIVVYANLPGVGGVRRGGHVIGEACQVWFDPVAGTVYPASEAACSPPTPKPVD